jgi:hypothetical protein
MQRSVYNSFSVNVIDSIFLQIHVDRYKHSILTHISDAILSTIVTRDPGCTRFHACERFDRCKQVDNKGTNVVYVNPVVMGASAWDAYLTKMKKVLQTGQEVHTLVRPKLRSHSFITDC